VLPELRFVGPEYDLRSAATFVRALETLRSSYLIVFQARIG
jgi:hypothetical protein